MIDFIWYEKYRPKELEDMILQENHYDTFEDYIEEGNIPHLLLYGPPGSGKTTLSHIFINELEANKLILNASSEDRGIAVVKGKIKLFASSQSINDKLKIVFLDEADQLTSDAQKALRNMIETYSKTCRFILTANYVDKILPALQSRCTCFEFSTFPKDELVDYLERILEKEKKKWKDSDLENLVELYYPDIRSILNTLQTGCSGTTFDPSVSAKMSIDMEGSFKKELMKGNISTLRKIWAGVSDFVWFYKYIFDELIPVLDMDDEDKATMAIEVATYMYQDAMVVDREINFTACCLSLMDIMEVTVKF